MNFENFEFEEVLKISDREIAAIRRAMQAVNDGLLTTPEERLTIIKVMLKLEITMAKPYLPLDDMNPGETEESPPS